MSGTIPCKGFNLCAPTGETVKSQTENCVLFALVQSQHTGSDKADGVFIIITPCFVGTHTDYISLCVCVFRQSIQRSHDDEST